MPWRVQMAELLSPHESTNKEFRGPCYLIALDLHHLRKSGIVSMMYTVCTNKTCLFFVGRS